MVQRIQSIYLFLAAAVLLLVTAYPVAQVLMPGGDIILIGLFGLEGIEETGTDLVSLWPVSVLLFTVITLLILNIFLYKRRTTQMRICMFSILLLFGMIALLYFYTRLIVKQIGGSESLFLWPVILPFVTLLLTYFALKAIQKDDAMIKSYERLR